MLGETDANWTDCVKRTVDLAPDSVTIYQMELPYNTTISKDLLKHGGKFDEPVAQWSVKRRWVAEAFEALRARRLHGRQRLHSGQESGKDAVLLSRPSVARVRNGRRSGSRRSATSTGSTCRTSIPGRSTARSSSVARFRSVGPTGRPPRSEDNPRVRVAAQARVSAARLFQGQVRRERSPAIPRSTGSAPIRRSPVVVERRSDCNHQECAAASRCAPATVLPAAAYGNSLYVIGVFTRGSGLGARGSGLGARGSGLGARARPVESIHRAPRLACVGQTNRIPNPNPRPGS